jgi:hypothetical protein
MAFYQALIIARAPGVLPLVQGRALKTLISLHDWVLRLLIVINVTIKKFQI